MKLERFEEALEQLEAVRDCAPREASVHFLLGKVCKKLGRVEEALGHFTTAQVSRCIHGLPCGLPYVGDIRVAMWVAVWVVMNVEQDRVACLQWLDEMMETREPGYMAESLH